jgi:hypothetical protein
MANTSLRANGVPPAELQRRTTASGCFRGLNLHGKDLYGRGSPVVDHLDGASQAGVATEWNARCKINGSVTQLSAMLKIASTGTKPLSRGKLTWPDGSWFNRRLVGSCCWAARASGEKIHLTRLCDSDMTILTASNDSSGIHF